jgi:2-C-methyl-D-erythritol 4-phosphate cytidylyltransferase
VVEATPEREALWAVQTPQVFSYPLLREAHRLCRDTVTDDAAMVERLGHGVRVFMGSHTNLKVTTPEDLLLAEAILRARRREERP